MFILDVETLDLESTAVMLALGMVYIPDDIDEALNVDEFIENYSLFVKFDVQMQAGRRTMNKDTLAWWKTVNQDVQKKVFVPDPENDCSPFDGIKFVTHYMKRLDPYQKCKVYTRGVLDPLVLGSFCKSFSIFDPIKYNRYRDIRTLIDTLNGTTDGYVATTIKYDVPLLSHHPVHDCVMDALQLIGPKRE